MQLIAKDAFFEYKFLRMILSANFKPIIKAIFAMRSIFDTHRYFWLKSVRDLKNEKEKDNKLY